MKYKKTITTCVALGLIGAGVFTAIHFNLFKVKETGIISFKSLLHCENSSLSKELPLSCESVSKVAMVTASNYKWNIPSMSACINYYGSLDCGVNSRGEVSIKPVGFSYIPEEKTILPVYYSASLSMYLLPNSYPIKLGKAVILGNNIIKNISRAKSLGSQACYEDNLLTKCNIRDEILKEYDRKVSNNTIVDNNLIIGISTGVTK